ncbi:FAD binding domain-containing protein [Luteibacter aegosomatissinici]|uniref:FAD binding domain-containing protein n=1 Tax=Luteibacter aegosomatissinici TaxID=2911539 RepID=UPI001FF7FD8A|nr:FAD binding domain-containing protein [Luteibacter aegosomatissinici]UPG94612.1 FAD binding domain-containing protein [Luteibacter aegosomatissinici]
MRIGIVGGSLGGLFAAALLHADGHDVHVYERTEGGLVGRGAGLVAQHEVFEVLRRLGVESVARVGVIAYERIVLARDGTVTSTEPTPQMQVSWDGLYRALLAHVPAGGYHMGDAVAGVEQSVNEAFISFASGQRIGFDCVVGADGIGSVVRSVVTPTQRDNHYAGYVAWRGLLPEADVPPVAASALFERFAFYFEPGSQMLGYLVPGPSGEIAPARRRYNWVWYRQAPGLADLRRTLTDANGHVHPYSLARGELSADDRETLYKAARESLPPAFRAVVETEPTPFVQAIFDHESSRMASGRIALLGDSAFVVRPHTAMGAAKAAGDAMTLVAALRRLPVREALVAYEAERLPVGRRVAAYGRHLGESLQPA